MSILKRGLSGDPVKVLQGKLGVTADGIFGPGTETALRDYQKQHGLMVDGVAGPDTFVQMGLYELVLLAPGTGGESVKKLQTALGVAADGRFGPATQKALRDFQSKNGLDADGLAGPATLAKMSSFKEMTAEVVKKSEAGHGPAATPAAGAAPGGATHTADATAAAPSKSIWERLFGHKST
jgi:peptidoglycan hydrolase-like protein with peptidoglycan-binding domain